LNPEPFEYEAGVLSTRLKYSVTTDLQLNLKKHGASPSTSELIKSVLNGSTSGTLQSYHKITFQHPFDPLLLGNRAAGARYTLHRLWQHIQYQQQSLDYSQMFPHAPVGRLMNRVSTMQVQLVQRAGQLECKRPLLSVTGNHLHSFSENNILTVT
jgi:hypothetical protein